MSLFRAWNCHTTSAVTKTFSARLGTLNHQSSITLLHDFIGFWSLKANKKGKTD